MFYYAMIDDSSIVTTTLQAANAISSPNMISITEDQYTNGNLIGKYYDSSTGQFIDPTPSVLADLSTEKINHGEEWLSSVIDKLYMKVPKDHTASSFTEISNHGMTERLCGIAYGNGIYVFVDGNGTAYTTTDLVTFTARTTGITGYAFKVLFFNGYFFIGTYNGEIAKSADGITWTKKTITLVDDEGINYCLAATGGKIATITTSGKVYVSSDLGETWTNVYTNEDYSLIAHLGNEFVLFGYTSSTSEDSNDWMNVAVTLGGTTTWVKGIGYMTEDVPYFNVIEGNGKYLVGVTHDEIWTSTDGIMWKKEGKTSPDHLHGISFAGDVAYVSAHKGYLLYNDLKCIHDWHMVRLDTTNYLDVATECNGKFIAIDLNNKLMVDDAYETKFISEV